MNIKYDPESRTSERTSSCDLLLAFLPPFHSPNRIAKDVSSVRIELIRKGETQVLKAKTPLLSGLKWLGLGPKEGFDPVPAGCLVITRGPPLKPYPELKVFVQLAATAKPSTGDRGPHLLEDVIVPCQIFCN